jgi:hypothetical protein
MNPTLSLNLILMSQCKVESLDRSVRRAVQTQSRDGHGVGLFRRESRPSWCHEAQVILATRRAIVELSSLRRARALIDQLELFEVLQVADVLVGCEH